VARNDGLSPDFRGRRRVRVTSLSYDSRSFVDKSSHFCICLLLAPDRKKLTQKGRIEKWRCLGLFRLNHILLVSARTVEAKTYKCAQKRQD
jgi:hypothetical protein